MSAYVCVAERKIIFSKANTKGGKKARDALESANINLRTWKPAWFGRLRQNQTTLFVRRQPLPWYTSHCSGENNSFKKSLHFFSLFSPSENDEDDQNKRHINKQSLYPIAEIACHCNWDSAPKKNIILFSLWKCIFHQTECFAYFSGFVLHVVVRNTCVTENMAVKSKYGVYSGLKNQHVAHRF